jgi:hypothetical protein
MEGGERERATDLGLVEERSMVGEDPVALLEGRLRVLGLALLLVAVAGVGRAPHGGDGVRAAGAVCPK